MGNMHNMCDVLTTPQPRAHYYAFSTPSIKEKNEKKNFSSLVCLGKSIMISLDISQNGMVPMRDLMHKGA